MDLWKKIQLKREMIYSVLTSTFFFPLQLYSKRTRRVDSAPGLHPAAAGKQGALRGPEETTAPSGAAAPRAGGVQAPTAGRAPETHRAAERAKETSGGGGGGGYLPYILYMVV